MTIVFVLWLMTVPCPALVAVFPDDFQCHQAMERIKEDLPDVTLWCEPAKYVEGRAT